MRRFFVPVSDIHENQAHIRGSDAHHLVHVLRKNVGEVFEATDGQNRKLLLHIDEIRQDEVICHILREERASERSITLRLFQALPKNPAWEDILTRACELGVMEIFPLLTERTIYPREMYRTIKPRWLKLVEETTKKTGRLSLMHVEPVIGWKDIPSFLGPRSLRIMPWENEEDVMLFHVLDRAEDYAVVDLLVGPEGGFSLREVEEAKSWGFQTVSLGKRILTTSTAVVSTVANIYYALERRENTHPQKF
ncbi:RsmE family RNA methyltransferase [Thermospira aquatica]|uniref:Ribosomal RNA small subunit methyltransferase E n=1 Tax=Thermospira aquatica TaxID=2828656 RepID=A0AAX3BGB2_9SPIR|nr:RsmE family RNA methyltransferase [Thermospira aquatica]URA11049.1 16S rRNA (uracil(1498)-N(3))-methyltransferase [Thermospira aquatica]